RARKLPHIPNARTPNLATGAGTPRRSGLRILAVVTGQIRIPSRHARVKIARFTYGRVDEGDDDDSRPMSVTHDGVVELVGPIRVAAGTDHSVECLHIEHGHERFAVSLDIAACHAPEIARLGTGTVRFGMGEMISAHVNPGGFAVVFVDGEIRV